MCLLTMSSAIKFWHKTKLSMYVLSQVGENALIFLESSIDYHCQHMLVSVWCDTPRTQD